MNKKGLVCLLVIFLTLPAYQTTQAQILKKPRISLKKKGKKILKDILGDDEEEEVPTNDPKGPNRKGKKLSPPDVDLHINNAEDALEAGNYSLARQEARQAILGVEIQLGNQVLEAMPTQVLNMDYRPNQDELYSTGAGFVGLIIARKYQGGDQYASASIVNNSTLMTFYTSALGQGTYSQTQEEGTKPVVVQGMKGLLRFDGDNQYELGIPIGQVSLFMLECNNFEDEAEVLKAANEFDLATYKSILGEQ